MGGTGGFPPNFVYFTFYRMSEFVCMCMPAGDLVYMYIMYTHTHTHTHTRTHTHTHTHTLE
jgi:hypothetical protein